MITFKKGNIFKSNCKAIVNPVNCIGVMGAGLAKEMKHRYPINFQKYATACENKSLIIGKCLTVLESDKYIINFPTKIHWRDKSKYEYIENGLVALVRHIKHYGLDSIAIPALGCGLGGLNFMTVQQLIVDALQELSIDIEIYIN
ncbi:MAG: macro domain-containing protein [Burkholderiales bacterium]|nr:macro domain-containing protein [Burkholderiales bacterium]